jgi:hypothetical protein
MRCALISGQRKFCEQIHMKLFIPYMNLCQLQHYKLSLNSICLSPGPNRNFFAIANYPSHKPQILPDIQVGITVQCMCASHQSCCSIRLPMTPASLLDPNIPQQARHSHVSRWAPWEIPRQQCRWQFITPQNCSMRSRFLSLGSNGGCFPAKDHWVVRAGSLRKLQTDYRTADEERFTGNLSAARRQYVAKRHHLWSLIETSVALTAWNL